MSAPSELLVGLLELLSPSVCPGCDLTRLGLAGAFCPACAPLLEQICPRGEMPGTGAAAFRYEGPLADALRRLKYGARTELAGPLGALLATVALGYAGRVDRVIPMPLHRARLRARGYNQSALLAR